MVGLAAAYLCAVATPLAAAPLVLTPRLTLGEQYNDNIFFESNHVEDYVTTVSPGLNLQYQRPDWVTSLTGGTTATWFARHPSQNQAFDSQSGSLGTAYQASARLTLTANDSVNRFHSTRTTATPVVSSGQTPQVEPPGPSTVLSGLLPRGDVFSNFFAGSASYRLSPRWTTALTYSNALANFTSPGGRDLTNRAGLTLTYGWSPVLSLNTYYTYSRFDIQNEPGAESHSAGVGAGYQFTPTWWFNGTAGFFVNRPIGPGSDSTASRTGPTFDVTLTKLFAHATASVGGSQVVTSSVGIAGTSITRTGFLNYTQTLLPRLNLSLMPSYSDFNTSATDVSVVQALAALSYSFRTYVSAGLSYSYRWRHASQGVPTAALEQGSVDGNLVQLYVTASYPVWRGDL